MIPIKNWEKYNNKPFKVVNGDIKKNDFFIYYDDGMIRKCNTISIFSYATFFNSYNSKYCEKIEFTDDDINMVFTVENKPPVKNTPPNLKNGDIIYYLYDYTLEYGVVESIGKKKVKIKCHDERYRNIVFDKVAEPDEKICVVWERNSKGKYRIERYLYENKRKYAKLYPYQSIVSEAKYGIDSDI